MLKVAVVAIVAVGAIGIGMLIVKISVIVNILYPKSLRIIMKQKRSLKQVRKCKGLCRYF